MTARYAVLASGSSGNCAFLQSGGFGLLIDAGLGPRLIASRLAAIGANWNKVHAVLLTHTHTDHWKDLTLNTLRQHKIPFYCHLDHQTVLSRYGEYFDPLFSAGLIRLFTHGSSFKLPGGVTATPYQVPHDSNPTFAFRLDGPPALFGPAWSVGYASDLGTAPTHLLDGFADVSVLSLEFNHDVHLEQNSRRPRHLIERVLGEFGHLSNVQAAQAVRGIIERSAPGTLRHIVQLHLSRECNKASLAQNEGRAVLDALGSKALITTARQDTPTNFIDLESPCRRQKPVVQGTLFAT